MNQSLAGKKIAIIATDGFEESELIEPRNYLDKAGAQTVLVSLKPGHIKAWKKGEWGDFLAVDKSLEEVDPSEFDALMIPGGVINPDKLRMDKKAVKFVQAFVDSHKPIAAICHGPQLLIETGIVSGRKITSWPSLRTDLINAGGDWYDTQVVVDNGLVTSRKPEDISAFSEKMIEVFSMGDQQLKDATPPL